VESYLIGEPLNQSENNDSNSYGRVFLKKLGLPLNHMYLLRNRTPRMQVVRLRKMIHMNLQIAIAPISRTSFFLLMGSLG
jgi:hypothetical protein